VRSDETAYLAGAQAQQVSPELAFAMAAHFGYARAKPAACEGRRRAAGPRRNQREIVAQVVLPVTDDPR
jgi:hypothetical protein